MENFLAGIGGAGQMASSALPLIASWATGGFKGRPQWRDLEFMNDVTNRLWPSEIKRQGDFLTGLAPSQAAAHNTFQDQTFLQGVGRETEGIKMMSENLGMNPWELTGQSGSATPIAPTPDEANAGSPMPQFLQGLVPLQQTAMSNKAMLQAKAMDNSTQLQLERIRQGGFDDTTGMGKLTQAQIEQLENAADKLKSEEQQVDVQTINSVITTMAQFLPTQTANVLGNTLTTRPGGKELLAILTERGAFKLDETREAVARVTAGMPPDMLKDLRKTLLRAAEGLTAGANTGMDAIQGVGDWISDFLPKQGQK